uniref:Uncharacterized protein n=1 Tax=Pipistrellus kuhlii TaxID=59472 RepID=A0A7J8B1S9_PIPKU|nr:hypothetical protein mPipKuh1_007791 [Pipistrellus kuhlii]
MADMATHLCLSLTNQFSLRTWLSEGIPISPAVAAEPRPQCQPPLPRGPPHSWCLLQLCVPYLTTPSSLFLQRSLHLCVLYSYILCNVFGWKNKKQNDGQDNATVNIQGLTQENGEKGEFDKMANAKIFLSDCLACDRGGRSFSTEPQGLLPCSEPLLWFSELSAPSVGSLPLRGTVITTWVQMEYCISRGLPHCMHPFTRQ